MDWLVWNWATIVSKCCVAIQNTNMLLSPSTLLASGAVFALIDHPSVCQEIVRDLLMDLTLLSNPIILLCMNKELRNQCWLLLCRHTGSQLWGRQWITSADEQHRKLKRSLPSTLPTDWVVTWKEKWCDGTSFGLVWFHSTLSVLYLCTSSHLKWINEVKKRLMSVF